MARMNTSVPPVTVSRQRHSQILNSELGGEVITDVKIDSASGYVAGLSVTGVLLNGQLNQDR